MYYIYCSIFSVREVKREYNLTKNNIKCRNIITMTPAVSISWFPIKLTIIHASDIAAVETIPLGGET